MTVKDLNTGPREPRSTVLTEAEEAMIVAFRRHTLLPFDAQADVHTLYMGKLKCFELK